MKTPNLERMIYEIELEIKYTVCDNCFLFLNEHKIVSLSIRNTNEDYTYTALLVCPLNNLILRAKHNIDYLQFSSKLMSQEDALYFARHNDQYNYEES